VQSANVQITLCSRSFASQLDTKYYKALNKTQSTEPNQWLGLSISIARFLTKGEMTPLCRLCDGSTLISACHRNNYWPFNV